MKIYFVKYADYSEGVDERETGDFLARGGDTTVASDFNGKEGVLYEATIKSGKLPKVHRVVVLRQGDDYRRAGKGVLAMLEYGPNMSRPKLVCLASTSHREAISCAVGSRTQYLGHTIEVRELPESFAVGGLSLGAILEHGTIKATKQCGLSPEQLQSLMDGRKRK